MYSKLTTSRMPAYSTNFKSMSNQKRNINFISIHKMHNTYNNKITAKEFGEKLQVVSFNKSSHYGIDYLGEIINYVNEEDIAFRWEFSKNGIDSWILNQECISIQISKSLTNEEVDSLVNLIIDLMLRYKLNSDKILFDTGLFDDINDELKIRSKIEKGIIYHE